MSSRNHSGASAVQTSLANADSPHPATQVITLKSRRGLITHLLETLQCFLLSHPALLSSIISCLYPLPCSGSSEWLGLNCFLHCFIRVKKEISSSKPLWCCPMHPLLRSFPKSFPGLRKRVLKSQSVMSIPRLQNSVNKPCRPWPPGFSPTTGPYNDPVVCGFHGTYL